MKINLDHELAEITKTTKAVVITAVMLWVIPLIWFWGINNQEFSTNLADWGAYGDFFGGILNPLVALAAVALLFHSVVIQRHELSETRNAMIDASLAQTDQARIAKLNMTLEIEKLRYQQINQEYQTDTVYFQGLLDCTNTDRNRMYIVNRSGEQVEITKEIFETKERILTALSIRDQAFQELEYLVKSLNT